MKIYDSITAFFERSFSFEKFFIFIGTYLFVRIIRMSLYDQEVIHIYPKHILIALIFFCLATIFILVKKYIKYRGPYGSKN